MEDAILGMLGTEQVCLMSDGADEFLGGLGTFIVGRNSLELRIDVVSRDRLLASHRGTLRLVGSVALVFSGRDSNLVVARLAVEVAVLRRLALGLRRRTLTLDGDSKLLPTLLLGHDNLRGDLGDDPSGSGNNLGGSGNSLRGRSLLENRSVVNGRSIARERSIVSCRSIVGGRSIGGRSIMNNRSILEGREGRETSSLSSGLFLLPGLFHSLDKVNSFLGQDLSTESVKLGEIVTAAGLANLCVAGRRILGLVEVSRMRNLGGDSLRSRSRNRSRNRSLANGGLLGRSTRLGNSRLLGGSGCLACRGCLGTSMSNLLDDLQGRSLLGRESRNREKHALVLRVALPTRATSSGRHSSRGYIMLDSNETVVFNLRRSLRDSLLRSPPGSPLGRRCGHLGEAKSLLLGLARSRLVLDESRLLRGDVLLDSNRLLCRDRLLNSDRMLNLHRRTLSDRRSLLAVDLGDRLESLLVLLKNLALLVQVNSLLSVDNVLLGDRVVLADAANRLNRKLARMNRRLRSKALLGLVGLLLLALFELSGGEGGNGTTILVVHLLRLSALSGLSNKERVDVGNRSLGNVVGSGKRLLELGSIAMTLGGRSDNVDETVLRRSGSGSGKTTGKVAKVERRSVTCGATKSKSRVDDARSG